jgi:hypothetical protein
VVVTPLRLALPLLAALVTAGCGGGSDADRDARTPGVSRSPTPTPTPTVAKGTPASGRVDPDDEAVIRRWADTLRRGDVHGAARMFTLPSVVANGTDPLRLSKRSDVRFFNRSLPCGAKLVRTKPGRQGFVIATFRLTERPGVGKCGTAVGAEASTAFLIKRGKIAYWIRVPEDVDEEPAPDASGAGST